MGTQNRDIGKSSPQLRIPPDSKTLYADVVHVNASLNGYVLNFAQQIGPTNQYVIVSRIGMSERHIKSLIKALEGLLEKQSGKRSTRKVTRKMVIN
jgi:hypothetical protein